MKSRKEENGGPFQTPGGFKERDLERTSSQKFRGGGLNLAEFMLH